MKKIYKHFAKIASRYDDLRSIDTEPLLFIKQKLKDLTAIRAADIGCGTGGYDIELSRLFGNKLALIAMDFNDEMINVFKENLSGYNITNINIVKSIAESLPLSDESIDCVFSFNTIHHFNLEGFLKEVARCLKPESYLFIYTRLRSQNKMNIWGRFFPKFLEKEKSLYEVDEIKQVLESTPSLKLDSVQYFTYERKSSLDQLLLQAESHHYSTFYLYYEPDEFKESLLEFEKNIKNNFENIHEIIHENANAMFVIRCG